MLQENIQQARTLLLLLLLLVRLADTWSGGAVPACRDRHCAALATGTMFCPSRPCARARPPTPTHPGGLSPTPTLAAPLPTHTRTPADHPRH